MTQPMILERHPDTEAVMTVLRGVNDEIAYEEIARQSLLSVSRVKSVLRSARLSLRRENQILFGTVKGWGLKLLSDAEKVRTSDGRKKRIANSATQGIKDLESIQQFDRLMKADQHSVVTDRTVFNVIRQQSKVRAVDPPRRTSSAPLPDSGSLVRSRR